MICFYDRRHRLSRELENTITHVGGLRAAMMAAEFVLSFQRGPWSNNPWRLVLEEELQSLRPCLQQRSKT
jgi:hypothetical protein